MAQNIAVIALLAAAYAAVLLSVAGLLLGKDLDFKLHYLAPAGVAAPALVFAAILVSDGVGQESLKAFLMAAFLGVSSGIETYAIARLARIHYGRVSP